MAAERTGPGQAANGNDEFLEAADEEYYEFDGAKLEIKQTSTSISTDNNARGSVLTGSDNLSPEPQLMSSNIQQVSSSNDTGKKPFVNSMFRVKQFLGLFTVELL